MCGAQVIYPFILENVYYLFNQWASHSTFHRCKPFTDRPPGYEYINELKVNLREYLTFVLCYDQQSDSLIACGDLGLGSRLVDTRVRVPGPGGKDI